MRSKTLVVRGYVQNCFTDPRTKKLENPWSSGMESVIPSQNAVYEFTFELKKTFIRNTKNEFIIIIIIITSIIIIIIVFLVS